MLTEVPRPATPEDSPKDVVNVSVVSLAVLIRHLQELHEQSPYAGGFVTMIEHPGCPTIVYVAPVLTPAESTSTTKAD